MATQKGKGKHSKNVSDNLEWEKDSATDVSSEGEKPLLKRGDFICSTGHNLHLKEDYEPNETLLFGRKVRRRKPKIVQSIESQSLISFPSDLTLSSQASSADLLRSIPAIATKAKQLQTVPEEAESRHYTRYVSTPTYSDLDSLQSPLSSSAASSTTPTPIPNRKKTGFLNRLWYSEDTPQQIPQANHRPTNKDLDFFDMAARTVNHDVIDTYEPYTHFETPKTNKRQVSSGSLPRSRDGRLLMPRESIVHPAGPFNEPLEAYSETTSYATAYDPKSGRQILVRRDSVIHPISNEDSSRSGDELCDGAYDLAPGRRNSVVRPLQMQRSSAVTPKLNTFKRHSITGSQFLPTHVVTKGNNVSSEVVEMLSEESIKSHFGNRYTSTTDSSSPSPIDYLPAPKYVNGRFEIPWETQHRPGLFDAIRWKLTSTNRSRVPKEDELKRVLPIMKPNFKQILENGIRVTWLGHSTVLVQMDNVVILTGNFKMLMECCLTAWIIRSQTKVHEISDRASPLWLMGPKRYRRPPCTISSLPQVDIVLISHNHYDHLDGESVRALNNRFGANLHWFVPLGLHDWMKKIGCQNTYEMSWWEEMRPTNARDIVVAFTPAQHWCKRALTDENKVLWGSWCVMGSRHNFFFAGDTGYCDIFKLIGERYGPFDLAAIPIGAYEPRWFMKLQNVNPLEAVLIHEDVYARHSIGIHWGTFALSTEHYLAPRKDLAEALQRRALPQHAFFTLSHGESKIVAGRAKILS